MAYLAYVWQFSPGIPKQNVAIPRFAPAVSQLECHT